MEEAACHGQLVTEGSLLLVLLIPQPGFGVCRGQQRLAEQVQHVPLVPAVPQQLLPKQRWCQEGRMDVVTLVPGPGAAGGFQAAADDGAKDPTWIRSPPIPQQISAQVLNISRTH